MSLPYATVAQTEKLVKEEIGKKSSGTKWYKHTITSFSEEVFNKTEFITPYPYELINYEAWTEMFNKYGFPTPLQKLNNNHIFYNFAIYEEYLMVTRLLLLDAGTIDIGVDEAELDYISLSDVVTEL
jgi:hypothetical protein